MSLPQSMKKILIVNIFGIGDVLFALAGVSKQNDAFGIGRVLLKN